MAALRLTIFYISCHRTLIHCPIGFLPLFLRHTGRDCIFVNDPLFFRHLDHPFRLKIPMSLILNYRPTADWISDNPSDGFLFKRLSFTVIYFIFFQNICNRTTTIVFCQLKYKTDSFRLILHKFIPPFGNLTKTICVRRENKYLSFFLPVFMCIVNLF